MAQLSDDCFAFGGQLLSVAAAQSLLEERVAPLEGEEAVPLMQALGRVLAGPLHATTPLPPFFNSAVDGYAVAHADLLPTADTMLALGGRVAAGGPAPRHVPGTATRIFTGAPMPQGADTVMMQEDAQLTGTTLRLPAGLKRGANARPAGEDVAAGTLALPGGTRLRAPEIGLAAALGCGVLRVRPRLRVGVFSTGDELVDPGTMLREAQTHDSNRFMLMALLAALPVVVTDFGILRDNAVHTARALRDAAAGQDLLLTSGGVSTGEEDHVRAAIEGAGKLVFWRLAIKPGRPAAMGIVAGTPVVGLPGNPVAAVVTFLLLARPLILRRAGADAEMLPRFNVKAGFEYRKKAGRQEYVRVILSPGETGIMAEKFPREGAGLLTSLTRSDAFAELPESVTQVSVGDPLRVLPFAALF